MGRDPAAAGLPHSGRQGALAKGAPLPSGFPAAFREPRGALAAPGGAVTLAFTRSSSPALFLSSRVSAQSPCLSMRSPLPSPPLPPPPPLHTHRPLPSSLLLLPFIKQTGDPGTWTLCNPQREAEEEEAERGMDAEGDL